MRFVAVLSTAIVVIAAQMAIGAAAQAQSFRIGPGGIEVAPPPREGDWEGQIGRLHQRCNDGDRRACVHLGFVLGEVRDRRDEWRSRHAEWFWWERER